tara:strand:- start:577 stop:1269 length:693 start_codon:yes stop_codon:yes gene_type:complete
MDYKSLQHLLFLNREKLFNNQQGVDFKRFSNKLGYREKTPFIGFIGRSYEVEPIRVLILGKANAPSKDRHYKIDLEIYAKAQIFKNASINLRENYRNYAKVYSQRAFKSWHICKYQNAFLNATHLSSESIAYANILPFRYEGDPKKYSKQAYTISFENFTNKLINIIKPNLIIPLGVRLDQEIIKHISLEYKCEISPGISRNNGDKGWGIQDQSRAGIKSAIRAYEELKS